MKAKDETHDRDLDEDREYDLDESPKQSDLYEDTLGCCNDFMTIISTTELLKYEFTAGNLIDTALQVKNAAKSLMITASMLTLALQFQLRSCLER